MKPALKSEFRKLLTVRTTYVITGIVLLFVCFIGFFAEGWKLGVLGLANPNELSQDVTGALALTIFGGIIAVLLMTHEYRYNTILHTVTSNRSRSTVLLSKIIVISAYALFLTIAIGFLAPAMSYLGVQASGNGTILAHQHIDVLNIAWRSLFFGWSWGMAGLLIATLVRSQVMAITSLFAIPNVIETLLALWLKKNAIYLPFASLSQVIGQNQIGGGHLSPAKGALIFSCYLVGGWLVAWALFVSRDAN